QLLDDGFLGGRRVKAQSALAADDCRNGRLEHRLQAGLADNLEHCRDVVVAGADVPGKKVRLYGWGRIDGHRRLLTRAAHRCRAVMASPPVARRWLQVACPCGPGA